MTTDLTIYEPANLEQGMSLASTLSKSSLVPKAFAGKPADILLVMMAGKELGLSTIQSLRSFYVLSGKVAMYADAMLGVCVGRAQCKYFRLVESTDKLATYETQREGSEPVRMSYSYEQAKRAGLTSNQTYAKHTEAMLRARCASALARVVYPDFLAGIYDPSELEDSEPQRSPLAPPLSKENLRDLAAISDIVNGHPVVKTSPPDTVDAVKEAPVENGPPMSPSGGDSNPFATEAEWQPTDVKPRNREQFFAEMKVPSGRAKGQYLSAQPAAYLRKLRDHVCAAQEADVPMSMTDINVVEACDYYLDKAEDVADQVSTLDE